MQAWLEYLELEGPISELRSDLRAGMIAAQVVNVNLTKDAKHLQPSDFFPMLKPRDRKSRQGTVSPATATVTATTPTTAPMTQAAFDEFRAKMLALGQTGKVK